MSYKISRLLHCVKKKGQLGLEEPCQVHKDKDCLKFNEWKKIT